MALYTGTGIDEMNPLFEKLLQAQAGAERRDAFRQDFEYTVAALQGVGPEQSLDSDASDPFGNWNAPRMCPAR